MRPSTEHDRAALKAAVRRAMKRAGGGDSFCHSTRVGAPTLSYYANPGRDDMHIPVDVAIDLDREAGAPVVAAEMARMLGYRLVPLDAVDGGPDMSDLAAVAGESADVVRKFADALADGAIDRLERADLSAEIDEARAAFDRLARKLAEPGRK